MRTIPNPPQKPEPTIVSMPLEIKLATMELIPQATAIRNLAKAHPSLESTARQFVRHDNTVAGQSDEILPLLVRMDITQHVLVNTDISKSKEEGINLHDLSSTIPRAKGSLVELLGET